MQTHLAIRTLTGQQPDSDTQALFATAPNKKALLFIHGFNGTPIKTWASFHEMLPACPKCSHHDIYFYGYDGLRSELYASVDIFSDFLQRLFENADTLFAKNLPQSAQRAGGFRYDEIIIVAHSLGAVVARRALVDATRDGFTWPTNTKLFLYAPAHKGARITRLAFEALGSWKFFQAFSLGAAFASPLIDQLKPNSIELTDLLRDTEAATKSGANPHLLAVGVVLAERERIVENKRFAGDPRTKPIPGTTHGSVCKPNNTFRIPLDRLEAIL